MSVANPYNYNLPVEPEMFFGRQANVGELKEHLTTIPGNSVALIGGRRVGKTSLLQALLRALRAQAKQSTGSVLLVPVLLDLTHEEIDSVPGFFRSVCEGANVLLAQIVRIAPIDASVFDGRQPPAPTFQGILKQWETSVQAQHNPPLRLILLIDGCEEILDQRWAAELYGALRYLLVGQATRSRLKVVMVGSHHFLTQVQQRGSPLQNMLANHMLGVLDERATRDLIVHPTSGVLPAKVVQAIINQTGGHPFLTQYVMHNLWGRGLEHATPELVQQIAMAFPHERNDFQDWMYGLGDVGARVYNALARAGANLTEKELRDMLRPAPPGLLHTLAALHHHGLIVQVNGSEYRVAGRMFEAWFKANVPVHVWPIGFPQASSE
jgi:hypothetical protein